MNEGVGKIRDSPESEALFRCMGCKKRGPTDENRGESFLLVYLA